MTPLTEYTDQPPVRGRALRLVALFAVFTLALGGLYAAAARGDETVAPGWHGSIDCFGNIVSAVPGVGEQGTVRIAYEPPLLVWYGAGDVILDTAYPSKPENCTPPTTPAPTTTTVAPTTTTTEPPPSSTSTTSPPASSTTIPPPDSSASSTTSTPPETSAAPTTTSPGVTLPLPTPPVPPTPPRPQTTQPEPYCTRFPNAEGCIEGLPTAETG